MMGAPGGPGGRPDQAVPCSSKQGLEPIQSTSGEQDSVKVSSPQLLGGEQAGGEGARHGKVTAGRALCRLSRG